MSSLLHEAIKALVAEAGLVDEEADLFIKASTQNNIPQITGTDLRNKSKEVQSIMLEKFAAETELAREREIQRMKRSEAGQKAWRDSQRKFAERVWAAEKQRDAEVARKHFKGRKGSEGSKESTTPPTSTTGSAVYIAC